MSRMLDNVRSGVEKSMTKVKLNVELSFFYVFQAHLVINGSVQQQQVGFIPLKMVNFHNKT